MLPSRYFRLLAMLITHVIALATRDAARYADVDTLRHAYADGNEKTAGVVTVRRVIVVNNHTPRLHPLAVDFFHR